MISSGHGKPFEINTLTKAGRGIVIRLTNLADYAVVLMSQLAQGTASVQNTAELAQATGVPVPTVAKITRALARAGVVTSQRGVAGGFSLARPADEITVADIIEAVDGPIALTNCVEDAPGDCNLEAICAMRGHWHAINRAVKRALAEVTLAEFAAPIPFSPEFFEGSEAHRQS